MNTMAATGMVADSSGSESPSTFAFPLLAERPAYDEEEKHDYTADDENEEVGNSFGYIPPHELVAASESNEDFGGEAMVKGDVGQDQSVENVLLGSEEDVKSLKDNVVEKVGVEHHTVIQDTAVVKKYSHVVDEGSAVDQNSDNVQSMNKLMAVTVITSSAVIDQQILSPIRSAATGEGTSNRDDVEMRLDKSEIGSQDDKSQETVKADTQGSSTKTGGNEVVVDEGPEEEEEKQALVMSDFRTPVAAAVNKSTKLVKAPDQLRKKEISLPRVAPADGNEEQTVDPEENLAISQDVESDTSPSAAQEAAHQTPDKRSRQLRKGKQSIRPKRPVSESTAAVETKATKYSLSPPKTVAPPTTSPTKPLKKKKNVSGPAPATPQGNNTSPKPSRKRVPVTPARSSKASKKRKKSLSPIDSGESGDDQSPPLRRSSRIQNEPPKFSYPVMQLADETVLSHFERNAKKDVSGSDTSRMTCKYCGKIMTASRGMAKRHLKACLAFSSHAQGASQAKLELPATTASEMMKLVQLMGTKELAGKLKGAFDRAPFAGDAPIARFHELINDDVTGLRHLDVLKLLDAMDPLDGPAIQLHVKLPGVRRSTGQDPLHPVSMAKARILEKSTLRFSAPRSVAEQFIVPLAKELGLEYAMRQHKASLVNCPTDGSVLDWRFLRTETVVFQLSGNALWKMKTGQVEHPLLDFQPQSWELDATAHVAKVHQVAAMDKCTVGLLTPPGEDLDIFDENKSEDVEDNELLEHILKPGSVAYVPAGTWFDVETEGANALWLEVHLASMTYEDLALSALKQLAWGDKQWRVQVQLYPGNRGQLKSRRHHMDACIKSLRNDMTELEGGDLLPEYLGTEDLQDLVTQRLIHDVSTSPDSTSIEVDLTNPKFKLKHEKVFKDADYRVNPLAILMSTDEVPHLSIEDEEHDSENGHASNTALKRHALKRIPKTEPKPKRKQTLRVLSQTGKHTYILDELFGNAEFQSKLHVKFQCSAEQSRLVEWLRYRGSEPFDLVEFSRGDDSHRHGKNPARFEESARNLLRFLYFVGYVTQVKTA